MYNTLTLFTVVYLITCIFIYNLPKPNINCPISFQENVFKFTNKYENETGFRVRSKNMKESLISGDMNNFHKTYNELYEQFEFFSTPPRTIQRNSYGLVNDINYIFDKFGLVNWKAMVPIEFLMPNK